MTPKQTSAKPKPERVYDAWGEPLKKGLPMIEMRVEELGDGIDAIAFVDEPAIGRYFTAFSRVKTKFSVDLKNKRVVGPLLIPNALVYRNEPKEHYQYFTAEGIRQAVHAFMRRGDLRRMNLMHLGRKSVTGLVQGVWVKQTDAPLYKGDDCPAGTAYAEVYVEDKEVLKMIQNGEIKGFSMEGFYGGKPTGKTAHSLSKTTMPKTTKGKPATLGERLKAGFKSLFGVEDRANYITVQVGETPIDLAEDGTVEVTMEDGTTRKLVLMEAEVADALAEAMDALGGGVEVETELADDAPDDTNELVDLMAETALRKQYKDLEARFTALQKQVAEANNKPPVVLTTRKPTNPNGIPGAGAARGTQPKVSQVEQTAYANLNKARATRGLPPIQPA